MIKKKYIPVILAGGLGTRIKHLLPNIPKPMANVNGYPFLYWIILMLYKQGFNEIIISVGYLANKIIEFIKTIKLKSLNIKIIKETESLGTAGGFLNIFKTIPKNKDVDGWIVLNGDSLVLINFIDFINYCINKNALISIFGLYQKNLSRYGHLLVNNNNELLGFSEKKHNGPGLMNAGIYFFKNSIIKDLLNIQHMFNCKNPLSFEHDIFPTLINKQYLINIFNSKLLDKNINFIDIGVPETLKKADCFILNNKQFFIENV